MDIERCFEILELDRGASEDEVTQAYRDIVNVWHPDRFSNNPRLKHKAEEKLKEVNAAYEFLKSYISSRQHAGPSPQGAEAAADRGTDAGTEQRAAYQQARSDPEPYGTTEAIFEAGTRIVLSLWSSLSSAVQRLSAGAQTAREDDNPMQRRRQGGGGGRGGKRAMGRGRGMGRRGGDKGRGRGSHGAKW